MLALLVTGSRGWRDQQAILKGMVWSTTRYNPADVLVVHGGQKSYDPATQECYGADYLAALSAVQIGMGVKPFPADWGGPCCTECKPDHRRPRNSDSYCPAAGNYRNQEMVNFVASLIAPGDGAWSAGCLAFPEEASKGTWDCIQRAETAKIPVVNLGYQKGAA